MSRYPTRSERQDKNSASTPGHRRKCWQRGLPASTCQCPGKTNWNLVAGGVTGLLRWRKRDSVMCCCLGNGGYVPPPLPAQVSESAPGTCTTHRTKQAEGTLSVVPLLPDNCLQSGVASHTWCQGLAEMSLLSTSRICCKYGSVEAWPGRREFQLASTLVLGGQPDACCMSNL